MMQKKVWLTLLVVLLLLVGATAVQAQENGAIRGTIYKDANADGVCGTGDEIIAGVPVKFTHSGGYSVTLNSGSDGTYGLAGVTVGSWTVDVQPPTGWRATSETPLAVNLSAQVNSVGDVNFCLAQGTTSTPTTLPASGAVVPPSLLIAAAAGVLLLIAGLALIFRERRVTG
ncbi:MAG: SdrD B-like domain-containing protein [Chloroflexota bacterium]|jgi:hypothetical protein